ncbi:MAG: hypothetical protein HQL05_13995 [Nitrospirae bacterium]|nr:hypothetical protein [Nitrospirota bacterium]
MQGTAEGIHESQDWFWTKEVQMLLKQAEEDYDNDDYLVFKNVDELISFFECQR